MSQHAQFSAVERTLGCRTPNRTYDFCSGELGRTVRLGSLLAKLSAESNKVAWKSRAKTQKAQREDEKGNTLRVERTERLEGSRFVAWQLYGLLAGGSRERLEVWQFDGPLYPPLE
jgi:hypothetical protein